ncbi:O-antigen ligase family protein [Halarsenatibacter silvermanii]|uniref:O-antigen ligase n=1 Tax=Halarsenatibacter silvermanii TaxID=321763 RepID=A0A1G9I0B2_9FIRM|nr:O-antigen ligase family protein [Halarsenatibacter silvermanii]SDL18253.1 O-antigen ligase [Halarsenatibacter silvermanii]
MQDVFNLDKSKKLIEIGAVLILFFAPFVNPLHYLGLLFGLLGWIIIVFNKSNRINYFLNIPLVKWFLVFNLISFAGIFYADYTSYAIRKWSRVFQATVTFLIFFEIVKDKKDFLKILNYFLIGAFIIGVHGILNYHFTNARRADALMGVNTRAIYFISLLFIPLFFYMVKDIGLKYKILYGLTSLNFFYNIIITKTRGAWIALFGGLLLFGVLYNKKILIIIILIFLISVPFMQEDYFDRARSIIELEDSRIDKWPLTLEMLEGKSLIFGVGPGNYYAYAQYEYDISGGMRRHTHNLFLQFAIELGLIGLIYISAFTINIFTMAIRACKSVKSIKNLGSAYLSSFLIILFSFYLHTLTHLSIHNRSTAAILMFLLAGFVSLYKDAIC